MQALNIKVSGCIDTVINYGYVDPKALNRQVTKKPVIENKKIVSWSGRKIQINRITNELYPELNQNSKIYP